MQDFFKVHGTGKGLNYHQDHKVTQRKSQLHESLVKYSGLGFEMFKNISFSADPEEAISTHMWAWLWYTLDYSWREQLGTIWSRLFSVGSVASLRNQLAGSALNGFVCWSLQRGRELRTPISVLWWKRSSPATLNALTGVQGTCRKIQGDGSRLGELKCLIPVVLVRRASTPLFEPLTLTRAGWRKANLC